LIVLFVLLRVQDVDLYYVHRLHPKVPVEQQAAAMLAVKEAGLARHIGVSEFSPKNLEAFHAVCPVTTVQQEWSLINRDLEEDLLPACRRLGVGVVAYSPLSRSILSDEVVDAGKTTRQLAGDAADVRAARYPRLSEENLPKNAALARGVRALAKERGLSLAQLSLAWVESQGEDVVPIPGTTKISHLEDNAKAMGVVLTSEESALVRAAVPADKVVGARFAAGAHCPCSASMYFYWPWTRWCVGVRARAC
jgi:aryl-alcohol dehydrogenase-like predicted oxidoreductase